MIRRFVFVFWVAGLAQGCGAGPAPAGRGQFVVKDPREVPAPPGAGGGVVRVSLEAREVFAELDRGRTFQFWAFNGTVPGPMIRATEGDTVEVELTNALDSAEPHNIDLHAVLGPGGGAAVTNVMPGETATLRFKATRRGTYLYHCAAEGMPWEHISHGMYGLIQVDPPGGLESGFRELYLAQSEWYVSSPGAAAEEEEEEEEHAARAGPVPSLVYDEKKAGAEQASLFTFNGHTAALSSGELLGDAMMVTQNDRVRLFFANAGVNKVSSLHVIGQIFDKVYGGDPADFVRNEETALVAPGSALVVELTASVPGTYEVVDHALLHAKRGARGLLHVMPWGDFPDELYSPEPPPDAGVH